MPDPRDTIVTNEMMRQLRMEEVRAGFESQMSLAFKYVNPRRHKMGTKGAQRKTQMYDGVAQEAFFDWVDGMLGWGVSESLEWHRAAILDRNFRDNDIVQRWLSEYTEQMDWEFRAGNFYENMPEQLQDAGSSGTAVMLTEESKDLSHCVHRVPHPDNYWIAENGEYEVDVYHELHTLTARQAMQKFSKPTDRMPNIVREWAEKAESSTWECDFLTCICPADDPAIFETNITTGRKKWALVTILYHTHAGSGAYDKASTLDKVPGDRLVRVEGMDYFPATVWRFRRNSDELYGFSPAMDVMNIIEAAQQHAMNLLDMGNFAARPMWAVPDNKRTEFIRLPGHKFYYGSEKRIPIALPSGGEYPYAIDREDKIHYLIRKRYGYDVWNIARAYLQKKERIQSAEINQARADQARLLSGQFNNFWKAGVRPTYDNVAHVAGRAGRLPPTPLELQELRGKDVVIPAFIGPLSQLQIQSTKLNGLQQGLGLLKDVGEILGRHIGPEEAVKLYAGIKLPDLGEYILDATNFPQSLMQDDETRDAIIAAREQRLAAEQEAKIARELAAASGQLAKEPGPNSLLAQGAA